MSTGQLTTFRDPALQREIANLYALVMQQVRPENLALQDVAIAIGRVIPFGQLRALEEFLNGTARPPHTAIKLFGTKEDFVLYAVQDDSVAIRTNPAVGFYSDSSAVETVQIQNVGNGRVLKLIGGVSTHEVLKLEIGAGSGRIIDTSVAGCFLSNGGVWTDSCTRARKHFLPLLCPDPIGYLERLPIRRYRYKGTNEVHFGPTAEEFQKVYAIGQADGLGAMDLAAVTALAVKSQTKALRALEKRVRRLEEARPCRTSARRAPGRRAPESGK